jgi:hypothetical protein
MSPMYATCPTHLVPLDCIALINRRIYEVLILSLCPSLPFRFSDFLDLCSALMTGDKQDVGTVPATLY